ncbi:extracellular solute-binding protein [Paenibacillus sp. J5C_2022]|uniref:extracellular solute-binding protein n=1 Tax=Paenibacillus sp. J5C2022 TaxID=2977129 RepID=UPI0021CE7548|nr:extracellular solute-binding protein [Paenibacillus sp. J5C2022]MCU6709091.1 extracellular solute-binding protein [Paenibacillus sp. J5C2022]
MKMKKFVSVLAATTVLTGALAACSSSPKNAEPEPTQSAEAPDQGNANENPYLASEKPLKLTVHMGTKDSGVFNNDWPIFKKAAELTNVTLEGTLPVTVSDFSETFSIVIASGSLPDIMQALSKDFLQYGPEGAFLSLNDLIDEHAPHLKKFMEENPQVRSAASDNDGNMWFIPFIADGEAEKGWFIRKDWLETLGLEEPKTVDELYKVITAFVNDDPNGNGKKDEVGFFHRNTSIGIEGLMALWNAYPSFRAFDDQVIFGPLEPEYGDAMANMAKWYKEGLIDKEIFTRGGKARDILLADNLGSLTHDFFASTGNYNEQLQGKIEGFRFEPMLPPADVNGVVKEPSKRDRAKNYGWGISHSNPDPVATIKYFDFWFSEEGRRMANFGIEGDTYNMVDGKPIFTDMVLKSDKAPVDVIRETGAQSNFGFQQDYFYEEQWTLPLAMEGINQYKENDVFMDKYPVLKFTEEEQNELQKLSPKVDTYIVETRQQWILGAKPVDHAAFVKELEKLGARRLVEINQAAYDRYIAELNQ